MVRILFQRNYGVYLPEISAYLEYIRKNFPAVEAYDSGAHVHDRSDKDFDVIWRFMGLDIPIPYKRLPVKMVVHEYGSASTGVFPRLKNRIKGIVNQTPQQRVFLNEYVERQFSFRRSPNVPHFNRDMGVADRFFPRLNERRPAAEYDFVFLGSVYRHDIILSTISRMAERMPACKFLIIGHIRTEDAGMLSRKGNVVCCGRVVYEEIPALLSRCRYGLNIMPDIYPFNRQTATKVLEYSAAGLPVISTRYPWIENFIRQRNGRCFWLDLARLDDLRIKEIDEDGLEPISVTDLTWDTVIRESKIFDFLRMI